MIIRLPPLLSELWQVGGFSARAVEETLFEDIERQHFDEVVGVQDDSGGMVF